MSVQSVRLEQRREATYVALVAAALELLVEGSELSLRGVAARMGVTGPALYRYVASYRELVDLVAFEIDRAGAERIRLAVETVPTDDPAGRLAVAAIELRSWALDRPRQFGLVFANPFTSTVDPSVRSVVAERRELITVTGTGGLFAELLRDLWRVTRFAAPHIDDLPQGARLASLDPILPGHAGDLAREDRGVVWVSIQAWTRVYGVVAMEVFGHVDPRLIRGAEIFLETLRDLADLLGVDWQDAQLDALVRSRLFPESAGGAVDRGGRLARSGPAQTI